MQVHVQRTVELVSNGGVREEADRGTRRIEQ
jgi:hypothetical protein